MSNKSNSLGHLRVSDIVENLDKEVLHINNLAKKESFRDNRIALYTIRRILKSISNALDEADKKA